MILSEYESKEILRAYGIPTSREKLAGDPEEAAEAAGAIGFPVAVKLCGEGLAHKTERDLVRLGVGTEDEVRRVARELLDRRGPDEASAALLVQEMIPGRRELIAGLVRDAQFGPCVMVGLGGIFTEAIRDVAFRVAPVSSTSALEMLDELVGARMLGTFRGEPPVDREALAAIVVSLGRLGLERNDVVSVDVNPLIVRAGLPVAVDALVERAETSS